MASDRNRSGNRTSRSGSSSSSGYSSRSSSSRGYSTSTRRRSSRQRTARTGSYYNDNYQEQRARLAPRTRRITTEYDGDYDYEQTPEEYAERRREQRNSGRNGSSSGRNGRNRSGGGSSRDGSRNGYNNGNSRNRGYEEDFYEENRNSGGRRLVHPERLIVAIMLVAVAAFFIVRGVLGSGSGSTEAQESSVVQEVSGKKTEETGTVRSVASSTMDSLSGQLSTYMASMIYSNPTNYKRTSSKPNSETPTEDVDLTGYRYVVAINAACGGSENGWTVDGAVEKNINLTVAKAMVDYMNNNSKGYYFYLVRSSDTTMTESQRLSSINNYEADLVITICCNGSDQELGGSVATYYERDDGSYSERDALSADLAQDLMEACAEGLGEWYRDTTTESDALVALDVPAVRVYMGFLTYSLDNRLLQDTTNQTVAAQKMGDVIISFCNYHAPEKTRGQLAGEALTAGTSSESSTTTETETETDDED